MRVVGNTVLPKSALRRERTRSLSVSFRRHQWLDATIAALFDFPSLEYDSHPVTVSVDDAIGIGRVDVPWSASRARIAPCSAVSASARSTHDRVRPMSETRHVRPTTEGGVVRSPIDIPFLAFRSIATRVYRPPAWGPRSDRSRSFASSRPEPVLRRHGTVGSQFATTHTSIVAVARVSTCWFHN